MLFKEMIAICSENHTKSINTICRLNAELVVVKEDGAYGFHLALKD
jgi:hypothetical protein